MSTRILDYSAEGVNDCLGDRGPPVFTLAENHQVSVSYSLNGVHVKLQLPRISHDHIRVEDSPVPLAVNVYTEPQWRGRGIARALMRELMRWASEQGTDRVVLHASDAGRPLYVSLGFHSTNEMRWFVPE